MGNEISDSERVNTGNIAAGGNVTQYFGDTVLYGEKKIPRYLTSPPFKPDMVIGRVGDLDAVNQKLWHENHLLLLVNGEGGIGKTTLAATYWLENAAKYQHVAWVYADAGIQSALFSLATPLGLNLDNKASDEDRWTLVTQQLANLNKSCLLVLDNANDLTDLQKHYQHLRQLPNFHILLTTRVNELASAPVWKVGPLDPKTAVTLFEQYYPHLGPADTVLLPQLLAAVGYNTLVIELLAKNLREINRFRDAYTLQNLVADLQDKGLMQLQAKSVNTTYGSTELRTDKPDNIVRAMYDLTQLNRPEVWLLTNLAVLPADSISYERLAELLTSAASAPLEESLMELYNRGWIDWNDADKTVKMSPVVQAVVRDKNQTNLLADCAGLVATLTNIFETLNHTQAESYSGLGYSIIKVIPDNLNLANLTSLLGDFNRDVGNFLLAIDLFERAATLFKRVGNQGNYSIRLERLGSICQALGHWEKALSYFKEYRNLYEKFYADDPHSINHKYHLGISYSRIGILYQAQGQLEEALTFFKKRHKLAKELHASHPNSVEFMRGLAISYEKLGDFYKTQGPLDQALYCFNIQVNLSEKLYANNPRSEMLRNGLSIAYEKLGEIYSQYGQLEQAVIFFDLSNKLMKDLYIDNPLSEKFKIGLATTHQKLGMIHLEYSQLDQALTHFKEHNKLAEGLYNTNPRSEDLKNGLAISYESLGSTYQAKDQLEEALTSFQKYNTLFEELVASNSLSVDFSNKLGASFWRLGNVHRLRQEKEIARSYFVRAEKIWVTLCEQVGIPEYCNNLAKVRWSLSHLA